MGKIKIEDIEELEDKVESLDIDKDFCVVGYYYTIIDLLNRLLKNTKFKLLNCVLEDPNICGYEDAYYLENNGNDIWVERGYDEKGCLCTECDIVFVEEDFIDDFLKVNDPDTVIEFGFTDLDDDGETLCVDDDRCGFCYCTHYDDNHAKFKYRGTKKLSDEDIEKIIDNYFT